ncbi:TspO/MBR family protein [Bacillus wiedmannii]|uniref:TspO/MBR family protein n=1 Tax=Bacillus wiedmannii TaxID=1890302 RepID=UPI00065B4EB1|nr:TspO/MBR family protein [Bacillus wiedmannii]KMP76102.1 membrane protein [Bacillus cereus]MCQ6546706.1 tryptophan-rich sensory protein [Bacillus wiedmannii]MCQ6571552.1 tryptophan-rich sensory protein [Bacillus wiedmannii]WMS79944.1 TspO/MBR family protein [Bacillus wiedmannii]HDR7355465.1 tryptophan-rich sensory protein [Bacillus wiedmannii]
MKKSSVIVFLLTYGLFYVSSILFPIDRIWYDALEKPSWTPSGMTIGIIWAVLYGLIALSVAIIYNKYGFNPKTFWFLFLLNYICNQAFSYFQFSQKNLFLATIDCLLVAVTAFLLIIYSFRLSKVAGWLRIPYLLWTTFATYLSWAIYSMN